jgi:hypothetical protein
MATARLPSRAVATSNCAHANDKNFNHRYLDRVQALGSMADGTVPDGEVVALDDCVPELVSKVPLARTYCSRNSDAVATGVGGPGRNTSRRQSCSTANRLIEYPRTAPTKTSEV